MSERDLIAIGFTPRGDGSLHSPGRITFTPEGGSYYRVSIELPNGEILTCHIAKVALKIKREEARPWIRIRRGNGPPTWGTTWIDLGRLRLIWCARHPSGRRTLDHPNAWMIVWRRGLPEWNPRTYWIGNEKPGRY